VAAQLWRTSAMLDSQAPLGGGGETGSLREVETQVHPTVEGPSGRHSEVACMLLGSCDLNTVL